MILNRQGAKVAKVAKKSYFKGKKQRSRCPGGSMFFSDLCQSV